MKDLKNIKRFNEHKENLNISDVRSRDFSDTIWDYLYNKWYSFNVNNIKKQYKDDSSRINFAINALKEKEDFIKTFKKDDKWSFYWFDYIMNDFYGDDF